MVRPRSERLLREWLTLNGSLLILNDDRTIDGGLLYQPRWTRPPFDPSDDLVVIDCAGTDLKVEAQTSAKLTGSIQRRAIELLLDDHGDLPWDVVLDDDGKGEIADVAALRIHDEGLLVRLVHCEYS